MLSGSDDVLEHLVRQTQERLRLLDDAAAQERRGPAAVYVEDDQYDDGSWVSDEEQAMRRDAPRLLGLGACLERRAKGPAAPMGQLLLEDASSSLPSQPKAIKRPSKGRDARANAAGGGTRAAGGGKASGGTRRPKSRPHERTAVSSSLAAGMATPAGPGRYSWAPGGPVPGQW